jgi:hypothetical protein
MPVAAAAGEAPLVAVAPGPGERRPHRRERADREHAVGEPGRRPGRREREQLARARTGSEPAQRGTCRARVGNLRQQQRRAAGQPGDAGLLPHPRPHVAVEVEARRAEPERAREALGTVAQRGNPGRQPPGRLVAGPRRRVHPADRVGGRHARQRVVRPAAAGDQHDHEHGERRDGDRRRGPAAPEPRAVSARGAGAR